MTQRRCAPYSPVDSGVVDSDEIIEIVRSLGQNTSRMAEWQTGTLARLLARHGAIPDESVLRPEDVKRLGELTNAMVPSLERLLSYAWHRQPRPQSSGASTRRVTRMGMSPASPALVSPISSVHPALASATRRSAGILGDDFRGRQLPTSLRPPEPAWSRRSATR